MSRWQASDWVEHALGELKERGPQGLILDALCTSAGRTRGSLYHHFPDHQALLTAVVTHWRERYTEDVIRAVRADALRGSRATARLNDLASALDFAVEVGVRRLAASYPSLATAIAEADRRRIAFLTELRRESGFTPKDARAAAELEYAAYIGAQHLSPLFSPARLRALYRHLDGLFTARRRHDARA
jgi:AcrR family transcriptional regulator